jgi:hypothetical protein
MKILLVFLLLMQPVTGGDANKVIQDFYEAVKAVNESDLVRLVVTPTFVNEEKKLSQVGYGEVDKAQSIEFLTEFLEGEKEIVLASPPGNLVNIYFLCEAKGFTKWDRWTCKIAGNDVFLYLHSEQDRIQIKLPEKSADILLMNFITEVEE